MNTRLVRALLFVTLFASAGTPADGASSDEEEVVTCDSHYDKLGVLPTASDVEIKQAYKQLALKWHPDKHSEDEKEIAHGVFNEIQVAHDTLIDPKKRKEYDASLQAACTQEAPSDAPPGSAPGYAHWPEHPGYPGYPAYPGYPGYPGYPPYGAGYPGQKKGGAFSRERDDAHGNYDPKNPFDARNTGKYTAAVVEFSPVVRSDWLSLDADQVAQLKVENLERLEEFAEQAKEQNAQIIVFPEYGITGDYDFDRQSVQVFLEEIPEDEVDRWNNLISKASDEEWMVNAPAVFKARQMAKRLGMVIVLNFLRREQCQGQYNCPADGFKVHNTAMALDEQGEILNHYDKRRLSVPEKKWADQGDEYSMRSGVQFETSFGVTFGMFISLDLIYFTNGGPEALDIVYPTDWDNSVAGGLVHAHLAQKTWSFVHHKNLLAASYGGDGRRSSGSAIWSAGTALQKFYNNRDRPESHLLVAEVPLLKDAFKKVKQNILGPMQRFAQTAVVGAISSRIPILGAIFKAEQAPMAPSIPLVTLLGAISGSFILLFLLLLCRSGVSSRVDVEPLLTFDGARSSGMSLCAVLDEGVNGREITLKPARVPTAQLDAFRRCILS